MSNVVRRSSLNKNLTLIDAATYRGMAVYRRKGLLVADYLERTYETIERSLVQYPRTLAMRIDLRFPQQPLPYWYGQENAALQRFFESFRAKIEHDRHRARVNNPYAHQSIVRYVWAREQDASDSPHFHCLLLVNRDAYYAIGDIRSLRENMINRIVAAWASALGLLWSEARPLVHFPRRGVYRLDRGDREGFAQLFYRVSYLSKEATKSYGNWVHAFGCSRC
jgi:hypothetical protein